MIIDARTLPEGFRVDADICIVGGGAAGVTMALELANGPLRVALFESGGLEYDDITQSLYAGPNLGFRAEPLDEARLRLLGGSTNHWSGHCMPLDPIDFEARDWIPYSGWPFTREDLDPYYLRAQAWVETPDRDLYDTSERVAAIGLPTIPFDPEKLRTLVYAESPPTAFGFVYEERLSTAENVTVYLHANALELENDDHASRIERVRFACIDGPRFTAEARRYILAAGGIEIPRLLLLSNKTAPAGIGNQHDLVGRFFMDHVSFRPSLTMLLRDGADEPLKLYTESHDVDDGSFRGAIAASEVLQRTEGLPNFRFIAFDDGAWSPGRRSAERLRRDLARGVTPPNFAGHLSNLLTDLDGVTNEVYRTLTDDSSDLINRIWLDPWISCESIPNPESRVKLIEERDDVFGQNRIALDWRLTDGDLRANRRATEILADEMGRLGYGRVWSEFLQDGSRWPDVSHHGKHHCGTTRMSNDPRTGVVDANCRVHGVANLHIASSSVFPTHGYATPTLTIVALAIRLADHIADEAQRGVL